MAEGGAEAAGERTDDLLARIVREREAATRDETAGAQWLWRLSPRVSTMLR